MDRYPKISIITIVYNGFNEIEKTIQSVLSQDYPNLDYIVIDGNSTDGTQAIVEKYQDRISYFESSPDQGISDAFNKGISRATGELIGLLNAGDILMPNILSVIAQNYQEIEHQNYPIVLHGNIQMGVPQGKNYRPFALSTFTYQMAIWHPTIFVNANLYHLFQYNTAYKIAMDYELFSRVYHSNAYFKHIDETIVAMDTNGLSNSQAIHGFKEVMNASRVNLGISPVKSRIYFYFRCLMFYLIRFKACLV